MDAKINNRPVASIRNFSVEIMMVGDDSVVNIKASDTSSISRAIAILRQISFAFCIYDFEIRMSGANSSIRISMINRDT